MKAPYSGNGCLKGLSSIRGPVSVRFQGSKDRMTVLVGGSVTVYKWKPTVIWHRENPRALELVSKHTQPVRYRSNRKSWITQLLSQDPFLDCCASDVEKCCLEPSIPFKILLIVNKAPGHRPFSGDLHPDNKVCFSLQTPPL